MKENQDIDFRELLKPEIMIRLYSRGLFPFGEEDGTVNWYLPEMRTIIPLDDYSIPRSLRKFMLTCGFEYRFDYDVMSVVRKCADREKTWISDELIKGYEGLHKLGYLHSVEVHRKGKLIGGLYGVAYRGAFFGESMFSIEPQTSKAALVTLIRHLNEQKYLLLDVQFMTDHLKMFGAREIFLEDYLDLLEKCYYRKINFLPD